MSTTTSTNNRKAVLTVLAILVALVIGISVVYTLGSKNSNDAASPAATPSASVTPTEAATVAPTEATTPPNTASASTGTNFTVAEIESKLNTLSVRDFDVEATDPTDGKGYEREVKFGDAWIDVDDNGCDTRNDMLIRDLVDVTIDSDGCTVLNGTLDDLYTGEVIDFVRGRSTSSDVQIDHMIPLSRAWGLGANDWTQDERIAFANDPENLLAVKGPVNGSKSDQGVDTWTPATYDCLETQKAAGLNSKNAKLACIRPSADAPFVDIYTGEYFDSFECEYVSRFVIVADKYDLAVTADDVTRINNALATCV